MTDMNHVIYQRLAPPADAPPIVKRLYEWGSFVSCEFLRGSHNSKTRAAAVEIFEAYHNAYASLKENELRAKVVQLIDKLEHIRDARGEDTADGSAIVRLREFEKQLDEKYPMPRVFVGGVVTKAEV